MKSEAEEIIDANFYASNTEIHKVAYNTVDEKSGKEIKDTLIPKILTSDPNRTTVPSLFTNNLLTSIATEALSLQNPNAENSMEKNRYVGDIILLTPKGILPPMNSPANSPDKMSPSNESNIAFEFSTGLEMTPKHDKSESKTGRNVMTSPKNLKTFPRKLKPSLKNLMTSPKNMMWTPRNLMRTPRNLNPFSRSMFTGSAAGSTFLGSRLFNFIGVGGMRLQKEKEERIKRQVHEIMQDSVIPEIHVYTFAAGAFSNLAFKRQYEALLPKSFQIINDRDWIRDESRIGAAFFGKNYQRTE